MPERGRIVIVQYLRGLAALSVAWFHMTNSYTGGGIAPLGSYGWLGVDVFFVISGFVIPYSLWTSETPHHGHQSFARFLLRRIVRIEPPYLASIALVVVLWYVSAAMPGFRGASPQQDAYPLLFHLFYLIPLTHYAWLQPVYWSLAYEFVFYIAVGLFYWILADQKLGLWLLAAVGLALAAAIGLLPPRAMLFVIGISLFRNIAGLGRPSVSCFTALLGAATIAYCGYFETAATGLLTAAAIKLGKSTELRNFAGKALAFLGTVSYSLYLTHVPIGGRVVNLGSRFVEGKFEQLALSLLAVAISIAFAWGFYLVAERPSISMSRRLFRSDHVSGVAAS